MISKSEELTGRSLRSMLAPVRVGDSFADSEEFQDLQLALEHFLPDVLRKVYPREWRGQSFDGFSFAVARKTGPSEAEFLGLGLLIADQTWTPVRIHLRAAHEADSITWLACKVGDAGAHGRNKTRLPFGSTKVGKLLAAVEENPNDIEWAFSVVREGSAPSAGCDLGAPSRDEGR